MRVAVASGRPARRRYRLRRVIDEAGSIMLGIVLLIWSLLPVYNMLLIALDPEEGEIEFAGNIWTPEPSLEGFRAIVVQQKTGRPVQFELLEPARGSILAWLEHRGGALDDFVFPSRIDHANHISTRQYARLVDEWVTGIGLRPEDYGTHSLRRTKASIIYKQTGNLRAVHILLGHTKIESTVRYLGVDVEDALALAEGTEV
jgi:integrase